MHAAITNDLNRGYRRVFKGIKLQLGGRWIICDTASSCTSSTPSPSSSCACNNQKRVVRARGEPTIGIPTPRTADGWLYLFKKPLPVGLSLTVPRHGTVGQEEIADKSAQVETHRAVKGELGVDDLSATVGRRTVWDAFPRGEESEPWLDQVQAWSCCERRVPRRPVLRRLARFNVLRKHTGFAGLHVTKHLPSQVM